MKKDKDHYDALIKHAKECKLKVRCVSSKNLLDFAAMNPRAAKDMHFRNIKKNEILLDKKRPLKSRVVDLRHELIEIDAMKKNNNKYFPAHKIATRKEKKLTKWEKENDKRRK
jgi:cell shape-determining protein MreC